MSGCIRVSRTGVRNDNSVQTHQQQYAQIIKVIFLKIINLFDKKKNIKVIIVEGNNNNKTPGG